MSKQAGGTGWFGHHRRNGNRGGAGGKAHIRAYHNGDFSTGGYGSSAHGGGAAMVALVAVSGDGGAGGTGGYRLVVPGLQRADPLCGGRRAQWPAAAPPTGRHGAGGAGRTPGAGRRAHRRCGWCRRSIGEHQRRCRRARHRYRPLTPRLRRAGGTGGTDQRDRRAAGWRRQRDRGGGQPPGLPAAPVATVVPAAGRSGGRGGDAVPPGFVPGNYSFAQSIGGAGGAMAGNERRRRFRWRGGDATMTTNLGGF